MIAPVKIAAGVNHEYASVCPFNSDNTLLVLMAGGGIVNLYSVTPAGIQFASRLPLVSYMEPRWSRTDPKQLFYVFGNVLTRLTINADLKTFARTDEMVFSEFIHHDTQGRNGVSGLGESDISEDGDHFVFRGTYDTGKQVVFVYSLKTKERTGQFMLPEGIDGLYLTGSNRVVCSTSKGIFLFDTNADPLGMVFGGSSTHMDVLHESIFYACGNDPELNKSGTALVDTTSKKKRMVKTDPNWIYAEHVSTCDKDFALISQFDPANHQPAQLWKVPFTGTPELLHEFKTVIRETSSDAAYTSQPKASLSRDGSLAVFTVDDGKEISTWMARLDAAARPSNVKPRGVKFDIAQYAGKSYFELWPGATGIEIYKVDL